MRMKTRTMNKESTSSSLDIDFSLHGRSMMAFAASRVSKDDAEDICQDACLKLLSNRVSPVQDVGAWLFTTVRNRIIDHYRRKKADPLEDVHLTIREKDMDPQLMMDRRELKRRLRKAIDSLPEEQRYVFVQTEIEGRSFKELSEETGLKINTLLSRKHKAVLRLREMLSERD